MSHHKLVREIVQRSNSDEWRDAKREWLFTDFTWNDSGETCLCGHYPIKEVCVIEHSLTGEVVHVGNRCIKKFLNVSFDSVFQSLKRVMKDIDKTFNAKAIFYLKSRDVICSEDANFYLRMWRRQKLAEPERRRLREINQSLLHHIISA